MACSKSDLTLFDLFLWVWVKWGNLSIKNRDRLNEMGQQTAALCTKVRKSVCCNRLFDLPDFGYNCLYLVLSTDRFQGLYRRN